VLRPCVEILKQQGVVSEDIPSVESVAGQLLSQADLVKDFVADTSFFNASGAANGKKICLRELSYRLDAWWGTYPFVSSGNSVATELLLAQDFLWIISLALF